MKVPSTVVWQLTKKWNSNLVTFNHQQFTRDPLSLTNLHNASQAGLSNDRAIGLQVRKEKAKKGQRRVISLLQTHKTHNKISKKKKNSQSGLLYSKNELNAMNWETLLNYESLRLVGVWVFNLVLLL